MLAHPRRRGYQALCFFFLTDVAVIVGGGGAVRDLTWVDCFLDHTFLGPLEPVGLPVLWTLWGSCKQGPGKRQPVHTTCVVPWQQVASSLAGTISMSHHLSFPLYISST